MFSLFGKSGPAVQPLPLAEAIRLAEAGKLTVVDVRDLSEVRATGRAQGALHVPLMLLQSRADPAHPEHLPALDPGHPVALYCASGGRSQAGAQILLRLGYRTVHNLGGFRDWQAAGGRVAP